MTFGLLNFLCAVILLLIFRMKPRLANPSFRPEKIHILAAVDNFLNLLRIRYSSPLFRLKTENAIKVSHFKFLFYEIISSFSVLQ